MFGWNRADGAGCRDLYGELKQGNGIDFDSGLVDEEEGFK